MLSTVLIKAQSWIPHSNQRMSIIAFRSLYICKRNLYDSDMHTLSQFSYIQEGFHAKQYNSSNCICYCVTWSTISNVLGFEMTTNSLCTLLFKIALGIYLTVWIVWLNPWCICFNVCISIINVLWRGKRRNHSVFYEILLWIARRVTAKISIRLETSKITQGWCHLNVNAFHFTGYSTV